MKLRSSLHDAIINSAPMIGKYVNKHELYRQFPPRRVKETNMNEIENSSCVINVMTVTPILEIEREKWDPNSILRNFNYGFYICT